MYAGSRQQTACSMQYAAGTDWRILRERVARSIERSHAGRRKHHAQVCYEVYRGHAHLASLHALRVPRLSPRLLPLPLVPPLPPPLLGPPPSRRRRCCAVPVPVRTILSHSEPLTHHHCRHHNRHTHHHNSGRRHHHFTPSTSPHPDHRSSPLTKAVPMAGSSSYQGSTYVHRIAFWWCGHRLAACLQNRRRGWGAG